MVQSRAKVLPSSLYEFVEMKVDDDSFDRVLQRPRRGSFSSPRLGRKSPRARPFLITSNGSVSHDGDLFDHLTETSPSPASLRNSLASSTPSSLRRSSAKKKRVTFRVPLADFLLPDYSEAPSEGVEDDHHAIPSSSTGDGRSHRRGDGDWSQRMVEKKIKWRRRRYQGWSLVDCCCCLS
eukprot:gene10353-11462_t